jgi:hypothetical protein
VSILEVCISEVCLILVSNIGLRCNTASKARKRIFVWEKELMEERCAAYWTMLAPNVESVFMGLTVSIEEEEVMVVAVVFEEISQREAKSKNSSCRAFTRHYPQREGQKKKKKQPG